jgi:Flp pilus assembly protein TadD
MLPAPVSKEVIVMLAKGVLLISILLFIPIDVIAQRGIGGQIFLPNGAPLQKRTRFTITTENGMRVEHYYTDTNGRISIPQFPGTFTITVESDGETYGTTSVTFDIFSAGKYLVVSLRPLATAPSNPPGLLNIGEVDRNVSAKAKEAYESATRLLESANYDQAIEPLKRAISLQPDYFSAYNDLGVVYMKLNRLDEAADSLRHAIKINSKIYLPQFNIAVVLNRQGKHKEAAEILLRLQKNAPDRNEIHVPLIEALIGAQMWAEAEAEITRALATKGADVVDLKVKLGVAMIRQSKFAEAVVVLREAVNAEPDYALAQFNLGVALLQTGNLDEAEISLRRAYEIKGVSMPGVQLMLGQLYFQKKDYPKALEAFETFLREAPDAPNASQVKEAIKKLKQATGKP